MKNKIFKSAATLTKFYNTLLQSSSYNFDEEIIGLYGILNYGDTFSECYKLSNDDLVIIYVSEEDYQEFKNKYIKDDTFDNSFVIHHVILHGLENSKTNTDVIKLSESDFVYNIYLNTFLNFNYVNDFLELLCINNNATLEIDELGVMNILIYNLYHDLKQGNQLFSEWFYSNIFKHIHPKGFRKFFKKTSEYLFLRYKN